MIRLIGFTTDEENVDNVSCQETLREQSIVEKYPEYDFILAQPWIIEVIKFWKRGGIIGQLLSRKQIIMSENFKLIIPKIIYIQNPRLTNKEYRLQMFIIDENKQWGMVDINLKVLITPQYDKMKWINPNMIEATKGNKTLLIDINNNLYV